MNIQAILDATANIAGGVALAGRTESGVWKGAGGIAGVKVAYSLPPESIAEDGPAHISFWDGFQKNPNGVSAGDLTEYRHRIRMQLTLAVGRSELPRAYGTLTPFVPLYLTAFAAKLKLNNTCTVSDVESSPGIITSIYPDRIAVEFIMFALEKEAVTYAA